MDALRSVQMRDAAVAQWIEYWPPKPRVVGSIPASRARLFDVKRAVVHAAMGCKKMGWNAIEL